MASRRVHVSLSLGALAVLTWWAWPGTDPSANPLPAAPLSVATESVEARTASPNVALRRTEVASDSGGLRVAVGWRRDGRSAAGVEVLVAQGDGVDPGSWRHAGFTSDAGELLLANLEPGWLAVRPHGIQAPQWRQIRAGSVAEVGFDLDGHTTVGGLVVDRQENPVGGAEVWLSETKSSSRGEVVTRSDAGGRFLVTFVGEVRFVAARAAGHGVSVPMPILPEGTEPVSVRLVLDHDSSRLEGEVVDGEGRPVPAASVAVGEFLELGSAAATLTELRIESGMRLVPPPVRVRSGDSGHFLAAACPTGTVSVMVVAPGFGLWHERTSIEAGTEKRMHVVLAAEASVSGKVRDATGRPVEGATIRAQATLVRPPSAAWDAFAVRSAADGSFRIDRLPPGEVKLEATHRERGRATIAVQLDAGQQMAWNPDLDAGLRLRVRVVTASGSPLCGFRVHVSGRERAAGQSKDDTRFGMSDADGRVVFANCLDARYRAVASPVDGFQNWPAAQMEDLQPAAGEAVLVVDDYQPPTAYLSGVVCDGKGQVVGCIGELAFKRHVGDSGGGNRKFALPARRFHIGPLHAGVYQLGLKAVDCAQIRVRDLVVEHGRDIDLGTLSAEPSGAVRVAITNSAGEPCGAERIAVSRGGRLLAEKVGAASGEAVTFGDVAAGDCVIAAWSARLGVAIARVTVATGSVSTVDLRFAGGLACTFDLRLPGLVFGMADLCWFDEDHQLLGKERLEQPAAGAPCVLHRVLPGGRYRLEVRGWMAPVVGAVDFQVVDPMPAAVLVDVREISRDEWRRWPQ